ncbi:NAF1-domain-containing protein [Trametes sanguinea]|nr:NAF1-domain-containing protein [Trametes sanguinea]
MAAAFSFAVPSLPTASAAKAEEAYSDHDHGTDSDTDSEKEVEADILGGLDDDDSEMSSEKNAAPSESTSDSDSSDSDFESEEGERPAAVKVAIKPAEVEADDEEDGDGAGPSGVQVRTKNEVVEVDIMIPEISEVGPHDELEKVGEVMSIVDKVVIVKGLPSEIANRGSERALDSDTLLVFEDRKVLGYIFETFGPTSEPLYQVRFNQKYPLDTEKVQVGRAVYHVPQRSNYVFVRQLRQFKGSDASNVHDEEPAEDELEFSDDEQEAAHKRALAQRREQSRARSVASSRHSTPMPSTMRDQDMVEDPYGGSSYGQSLSYNDMDFGAGPSRPAPIPYDDPYSDSYGAAPTDAQPGGAAPPSHETQRDLASQHTSSSRGRGGTQRRDDSGRGRGRGRGRHDRGRGRGRGHDRATDSRADGWAGRQGASTNEPPARDYRAASPTSLAIAHATGQYGNAYAAEAALHGQIPQGGAGGWGYPAAAAQSYDFSFGYQYPQYPRVQPHINPRFASNFGMAGMGMGYNYGGQPAPYSSDASGYNASSYPSGGGGGGGGWNGQWSRSSQSHPGQDERDGSQNS